MSPRIVDKKAKHEKILDAAMRVFARSGMYDFKMIDIAVEAGVGKGTLYEYFASKDELIAGSFARFFEAFDQHLLKEISDIDSPVEKLERLVSASLEFCLEEKDRLDTLFDFYAASIPRKDGKQMFSDMVPMYQRTIEWVSSIVADGVEKGLFRPVDSTLVASIILAMLDGLMFQVALGVTTLRAGDIGKQMSQTLLQGILATPE